MKIYTKTGDFGETALFGGERVLKTHPRIDAYGTLDELNSVLGLASSFLVKDSKVFVPLRRVQMELFSLGAELATPESKNIKSNLIGSEEIKKLESNIDEWDEELAPLKNFILPGGAPGTGGLHLARTVCRRAERSVLGLLESEKVRPEVIQYLNRLSDFLFVAARYAEQEAGGKDIPWISSR
jgi:cob(I)alamin adenosyltransferase